MRTVLSEQAVAMSGREGCGADCQVRETEGGFSVDRRMRAGGGGMVGLLLRSVCQPEQDC